MVLFVGKEQLPIIQTWKLNANSTEIPLTAIKANCNHGPLVSLQLRSRIGDVASDETTPTAPPLRDASSLALIVNGGLCSSEF